MSDTNATDDVVEENAWLDDFENEVVTPAWEEAIDDSSDVIEGDIVTDDDLDLVGIAPSAALDINGTDPLDANQAKELTEYIRSTSNVLYVLIERAHSGKAHTALGYKTFEEYVRAEFDISRSRAYQLLNQSRVISELESALPEGTPVHITEAAARDLKHALDDLVPEIRERTADLSPDVAGEVLEEMVANYREEKLRAREEAEEEDLEDDEPAYTGTGDGTYQGGYDEDEEDLDLDDSDLDDILAFDDDPEEVRKNYKLVYELYASLTAISSLSSAPDVQKLIDIIPPERRFQIDDSLPKSLEWMTNFAEVWNSQPWKQASEENNNLDLEEDVDVDFDEDFTDISDENL
jgi:hypothetical protein